MWIVATLMLTALAGCTPWATYPNVKGMTEIGSATTPPVPTLMARAIGYVKDNKAGGADYAINLPPGVPANVYADIKERLGFGNPMISSAELAYHVTEIRLRGLNAEVDVVYPDINAEFQLVTLYFRNSVMPGWNVVNSRQWAINVNVPGPHYVAPNEAIVTETGSKNPTP